MNDPATETRRRMAPCATCRELPAVCYEPGCLYTSCQRNACLPVAVPDQDIDTLLDAWHADRCGPGIAAWWRQIRARRK
jgi:hypothetical protein